MVDELVLSLLATINILAGLTPGGVAGVLSEELPHFVEVSVVILLVLVLCCLLCTGSLRNCMYSPTDGE